MTDLQLLSPLARLVADCAALDQAMLRRRPLAEVLRRIRGELEAEAEGNTDGRQRTDDTDAAAAATDGVDGSTGPTLNRPAAG